MGTQPKKHKVSKFFLFVPSFVELATLIILVLKKIKIHIEKKIFLKKAEINTKM